MGNKLVRLLSRTQNLLIEVRRSIQLSYKRIYINIIFYEKNINLIVNENENNLRVDVLINKRELLISRNRIKNLILNQNLKLNNKIIKNPSKKVIT